MQNKILIAFVSLMLPSFVYSSWNGGGSEGGLPTSIVIERIGAVGATNPCTWYKPVGTEHDPQWMCAQLKVTSGEQTGQVLEVVFPGSDDVVWYASPKLKGYETGTFGLNTVRLPGHLVLAKFTPSQASMVQSLRPVDSVYTLAPIAGIVSGQISGGQKTFHVTYSIQPCAQRLAGFQSLQVPPADGQPGPVEGIYFALGVVLMNNGITCTGPTELAETDYQLALPSYPGMIFLYPIQPNN